jgi:DNA mismatch repair ATPase MutS
MALGRYDASTGVPMLEAKGLRHPAAGGRGSGAFVPNDIALGGDSSSGGSAPFIVLSGPNMGGKSTLLRQTCLAAVMAQVGAWVPAESLRLHPVDAIFVRMGAKDNIMSGEWKGGFEGKGEREGGRVEEGRESGGEGEGGGYVFRHSFRLFLSHTHALSHTSYFTLSSSPGQSTFYVELAETAAMLHKATPRSLVALDELGRGTATLDGAAIAGAVLEHMV